MNLVARIFMIRREKNTKQLLYEISVKSFVTVFGKKNSCLSLVELELKAFGNDFKKEYTKNEVNYRECYESITRYLGHAKVKYN